MVTTATTSQTTTTTSQVEPITPPPDPPLDSVNHPFFLHQNDHPDLLRIAKKLTGSDNYNSWKRSMTIALNAKNKLKIVTGEYPEPSPTSDLRPLWERTNDMVISWVLNDVSDEISNNLNFVSSAFALWKELSEHYSQLDGHRIFQDELEALEALYTCNYTCTCENGKNHGAMEQRKKLVQFLMGLDESYTNESYTTISIALNTTAPCQTYTPRYNIHFPTTAPSQTYTPRSNLQIDRKSALKKGIICTYCHRERHTKDECYKLVGYPSGHPQHHKYQPPPPRNPPAYKGKSVNLVTNVADLPSTSQDIPYIPSATSPHDLFMNAKIDQLQNQLNQVMLFMQQAQQPGDQNIPTVGVFSFTTNSMPKFRFIACCLSKSKGAWISDSGATYHISNSHKHLHYIYHCKVPISLSLPNGQTVLVTIIGPVKLNDNLTLKNVFYVPSFTYNLLSISRLLTPHSSVTFTHDSVIFQDHDKKIAQGIFCNGLYLITPEATPSQDHSQATILSTAATAHI
uniref:uncharacterized protein LOC122604451 n=1 Tax=Erigeron canadensis TaxID=72917 RepID=UPI001CB8FD11|nr:uncharacterized protein LOC122604451 [Erigeron canadensis]